MTTTEEAPATEKTESVEKGSRDFTKIVEKEPTNLHSHYWDWIKDKTGYESSASDEEAVKIVQMAVSLYQPYQASAENKQRREDEKAQRETLAEQKKAEREAAKAAKAEEAAKAKEAAAKEAEAAGDGDGAKRQPPPRKGAAAKGGAAKAASGEAPF